MAGGKTMTDTQQALVTSNLGGVVKLIVKTFLEKDHYRKLVRVLGEQWSGAHSMTAALRLMESHGVRIAPEEQKKLLGMTESDMIDTLVSRMPQQSREQFEHFFLQLSLIASTTVRLRTALEEGHPDQVEEALESAENVGILPFLMKMVVAQAGAEVATKDAGYTAWLTDTDEKMRPLVESQATAMGVHKELAAAKAALGGGMEEAREKSQKMLMRMSNGSDKAMILQYFTSWSQHVARCIREAEIRKDYEEEIVAAQKKLMDYKMSKKQGAKNILMKNAARGDMAMISSFFGVLVESWNDAKNTKSFEEKMKALGEASSDFAVKSRNNAQKVMARMNAGNDQGIMDVAFESWKSFVIEYKKDKEMNDAIKAAEQRVAEFQKKNTDNANGVIGRMNAASTSGLLQSVMSAWEAVLKESKEAAEMEDAINQKASKMSSFASKNKETALSATEKKCKLEAMSLTIPIFSFWKRETKVERMRTKGKELNQKKRQDLVGVKGLFKDFAGELEASLKEGTPRAAAK